MIPGQPENEDFAAKLENRYVVVISDLGALKLAQVGASWGNFGEGSGRRRPSHGSAGNYSDVCFILIFQRKHFDLLVMRRQSWLAGPTPSASACRLVIAPA